MTSANVKILADMVAKNPNLVADEIVYASNHGIDNHAPILALVYLSMGNDVAKSAFKRIFNSIVRTASMLYEFMEYTKSLRGFGKLIHTTIDGWFGTKEVKNLEYQFLKYQNRYNWTGRDVLRKIKIIPRDNNESSLFSWIAGKGMFKPEEEGTTLKLIPVYENLKTGMNEVDVIKAILDYNLTHEMIPANIERTTKIWEALYQKMPITATLRNLANLTNKDVFTTENIGLLEDRFSKENLRKGRVHPISVAVAYKIYTSAGNAGRTSLSWKPIPRIEDILERAVNDAFEVLEPTGKTFYHAVDVSGSMSMKILDKVWMSPMEISAIMALATLKTEKNYFTSAFSKDAIDFPDLRKSLAFGDIIKGNHLHHIPREYVGSGTDLGSAITYATNNKIKADALVFWTDGQTWMGQHPSILLKEYREKMNPDAKAIFVTMLAYGDHISLTDPRDGKSYDICGFNTETPKLITMIANGEL
jgi:60 kDa SS-A/Ro ribonucleoprotein